VEWSKIQGVIVKPPLNTAWTAWGQPKSFKVEYTNSKANFPTLPNQIPFYNNSETINNGEMDMATKFKFDMLKDQFKSVGTDILESVFIYNKYNLNDTIKYIYTIFPTFAYNKEVASTTPKTDYPLNIQSTIEKNRLVTKVAVGLQ